MAVTAFRRAASAAPTPPSQSRQALAEAIAERDAVQAIIQRLGALSLWGRINDAEAAEAQARATLSDVEEAWRLHRIGVLTGEASGPGPDVAGARAAVDAAVATLADLREAQHDVTKRVTAAEAELPRREDNVSDAARMVLMEETASLAEALRVELESLQVEFLKKALALEFLTGLGTPWGRHPNQAALSTARTSNTYPKAWPVAQQPSSRTLENHFRGALEALKRDPAAHVPSVAP